MASAEYHFAPLTVGDFVELESRAADYLRFSRAAVAKQAGASQAVIDDMAREDVRIASEGSGWGSSKFDAYIRSEAGLRESLLLSLRRGASGKTEAERTAYVESLPRHIAEASFWRAYGLSLGVEPKAEAPANPPQPPTL